MAVVPRLESIPFPDPRRNAAVDAGADLVIWQEYMTGGFIGFLERLSVSRGDNLLGCNNTWVDFRIDGTLIERVQREISENMPDIYKPEMVVRKKIEFRAHNGDTAAHQFEVIAQGRLCRPLQK